MQTSADRAVVVGSNARGLQAAFFDPDGSEVARWGLPAAALRYHCGSLYCAVAGHTEGLDGVALLVDGHPRWLVDTPAFNWGLDGALAVIDTWDGWQATSELTGFSLEDGAQRFRAAGGPNATLLPAGGRLASLETAAAGPVVVLRELRDGAVLWRSAPVGVDVPGLFGRCTGAATLLSDDVVVWLHGRGLVRLALADGAHRGEMALQSLPPAGVTATTHGLLLRSGRTLSMLTLTR